MKSLRLQWILAIFCLGLAGVIAELSWTKVRVSIPEMGKKQIEPSLGQGMLLGILGGFRTVVADGAWIRSYVLWERRDRAGCEALMRTSCLLDPRARFFWENTGYVIGYDMAHWEIRKRGGYAKVSPEIQDDLFKKYAQQGIRVMEEGVKYTGGNVGILISAGQMSELKLKDFSLAASYYKRASESKNPPWFVHFLCAKALWESGQTKKAYDWYRDVWQKKLSKEDDYAPDDLEHLRYMEEQLHLPVLQRIPRQSWEKNN